MTNDVWYVRRVRLNNGGYTSQGYYFGHGGPLYEAYSDREHLNFRASDRQDAIEQLMRHAAWRYHSDNPKLARR